MQCLRTIAVSLLLILATSGISAAGHNNIVIGISQFPSNLHPNIESMAAKSYVLGHTQRPLSTYDAALRFVCLHCTDLPTFTNGRAVKEPQPDGTTGVALTYTLQPGVRWGDGVPVSTKDVLFTLEVGLDPQSGFADA